MTENERKEILLKECLSIKDFMKLFDMPYPTASEQMRDIKKGIERSGKTLRVDINGKIHTSDYFDFVDASKYPERYYLKSQGEVAQ